MGWKKQSEEEKEQQLLEDIEVLAPTQLEKAQTSIGHLQPLQDFSTSSQPKIERSKSDEQVEDT